jgi:hypothetical protein
VKNEWSFALRTLGYGGRKGRFQSLCLQQPKSF